MADIENVTLAASGESYIDLSDVTGVKKLRSDRRRRSLRSLPLRPR